jgi:hypothetical protein
MKAILSASLGIALAATAVCGSSSTANAHDSGGIGLGIIGGLAAGAIIGSAVAPRPYYAAPTYYESEPVYYDRPRCYWTAGRAFWDDYRGAWVRPRVRVCD